MVLTWRSNEFFNKLSTLSNQQYKRIMKLYNEDFYLLDNLDNSTKFKISGSTKNIYTITFNNTTNKFWCDCPDMKLHCNKHDCVCKHICFMVIRVLKNLDLIYFSSKQFNCSEAFQHLNNMEELLINSQLTEKYKLNINNFDVKKDYTADGNDDDCSICYDSLGNNKLLGCPQCKNSFHKKCMEKWLQLHETCVYCRSECCY